MLSETYAKSTYEIVYTVMYVSFFVEVFRVFFKAYHLHATVKKEAREEVNRTSIPLSRILGGGGTGTILIGSKANANCN